MGEKGKAKTRKAQNKSSSKKQAKPIEKDNGASVKTKKVKEPPMQSEHKKFLKRMRAVLIPKSIVHDYVAQRIERKLQKYKKLFITGRFESQEEIAMNDANMEPAVPDISHSKSEPPALRPVLN